MSNQTSSSRSDLWGGVCWMAFGAFILIESFRMDRFDKMGATIYTYPGFVPGMIASVIVLLGFVMVMRGVRSQTPPDENAEPLANRRFLIALVCMLVFSLVLLAHAHFLVATFIFVAAFTYLFADPGVPHQKRVISAVVNGAISSCVVYFLFQEVFLVRLP